jgi:excisionase family DNA binding protein
MKLLSTADVARRLKVTQRRVVAMIISGKIKAHRVARDYVIEESALEGIKVWAKVGRPPWKGQPKRKAA